MKGGQLKERTYITNSLQKLTRLSNYVGAATLETLTSNSVI